jgi:predicted  nucleic acid-binding Zn-ribbon protein
VTTSQELKDLIDRRDALRLSLADVLDEENAVRSRRTSLQVQVSNIENEIQRTLAAMNITVPPTNRPDLRYESAG